MISAISKVFLLALSHSPNWTGIFWFPEESKQKVGEQVEGGNIVLKTGEKINESWYIEDKICKLPPRQNPWNAGS